LKRGHIYDSATTPLQQGGVCSSRYEIYEFQVRPQVEEGNYGKIVAINTETGVFRVGDDITMRQLIAFCVCFLCVPTAALAGIPEIRSMSQNSEGYFNVNCLNGNSETVNAQAIAKNSVCKVGNQTSSLHDAVVCTGNQFQDWFYVTRVSDGKQFGDFGEKLSLRACQKVVRASSPKVVCTGNEFQDWFYLTRISDGKKLGERLSLQNCLQLSSGRK
jgi:hypothetical protein